MRKLLSEPPVTAYDEPLPGAVCAQLVRCGRRGCRCASGEASALHGPYFYHFWREGRRLRKRYLKASEVAATRAACERGQAERQQRAAYRKAHRMAQPPALRHLMNEVEAMLQEAKAS